jgi:preprotein translocase subunit SecG
VLFYISLAVHPSGVFIFFPLLLILAVLTHKKKKKKKKRLTVQGY